MVMEIECQNKIASNLNLNLFSATANSFVEKDTPPGSSPGSEQEQTNIFTKKDNFMYDELTPSSSLTTSECYSSNEIVNF